MFHKEQATGLISIGWMRNIIADKNWMIVSDCKKKNCLKIFKMIFFRDQSLEINKVCILSHN